MITGCLSIFLVIIFIYLIIAVGIIILPFIALFFFITSHSLYSKSKNLQVSKMECPNCNSNEIKIQSIRTGDESNSNISGAGLSGRFRILGIYTLGGRNNSKTRYTFKREGVCQKCGFNFDYLTQEDVNNMQENAKNKYYLSIIFLIISIILCFTYMSQSTNNTSNNTTNTSSKVSNTSSTSNSITSVWAQNNTPIEDFDYYLEGNNIYLKKYIGTDKNVRISSTYIINGNNYNITSFSEGVFALKSIDSVILPDGLTSMPANTFNSCGVKFIYIPATLQNQNNGYPFYRYFHNIEKIYYGSTEEQWKNLTNNADRSSIDVKEIVYNANVEDLK